MTQQIKKRDMEGGIESALEAVLALKQATSKDVADVTGIRLNTVRPYLCELKKRGLLAIKQTGIYKYWIPGNTNDEVDGVVVPVASEGGGTIFRFGRDWKPRSGQTNGIARRSESIITQLF